VLKLHCSVGDHQPTDPRLDPVWDYVESIRLPVVVHAGHGIDGMTEVDELGPIDEVARRHPEARIVIAHCGHRASAAALDLLEQHDHVHADITPVVRELVEIPPGRAAAAAHKLLLGTDTPNTCIRATTVVEQVRSWHLDAVAEAAVLGGTAARLQAEILR
jgi:predicted TIM-barrel fold metal-dependent hydrolase